MSPALAGGFLTTVPPGKPDSVFFDAQKFLTVMKSNLSVFFLVFLVIWCYTEQNDAKSKVMKIYP